MIHAYPLCWPANYPRTPKPGYARFDTKFADARDGILKEIKSLGGKDAVISSNIPTRSNGNLYATFTKPKDHGVAVYFIFQGQPVVFACDTWNRIEDNMQAIRRSIQAMRALERWGVSEMLKRTFTGFKALPRWEPWYMILGVTSDASESEIKTAYRKLAKESHTDIGGNPEDFHRYTEAYKMGLETLKKKSHV